MEIILIKPKEHFEIYNALYQYDNVKNPTVVFQKYNVEKFLFYLGFGLFLLAIILAITSNLLSGSILDWVISITWIFVALSQISIMLSQLIYIFSMAIQLKKPVKFFLEPLMQRTKRDFDFAKSLTRHEASILKSVRDSLEYESVAMYSRVGTLVGTVDKTGLVFSSLTIIFAYLKLSKNLPDLFEEYDFVVYIVVGWYFMGLYFMSLIYKLKKFSLLVNMAIDIKEDGINK